LPIADFQLPILKGYSPGGVVYKSAIDNQQLEMARVAESL
jgi:hypothetical protein